MTGGPERVQASMHGGTLARSRGVSTADRAAGGAHAHDEQDLDAVHALRSGGSSRMTGVTGIGLASMLSGGP
jgi:hypothetical protein